MRYSMDSRYAVGNSSKGARAEGQLRRRGDLQGGKKISCCHSEASERLASPLLEAY
jgi:hypothetical protein